MENFYRLSNSIYLEIFILQQGRVQIILHICIIIKCNHEMKFAFGEIVRVRIRSFWILIPLPHSHQGRNCSRLLPANGQARLGARAQHRTLLMGKFCSGFPPTPISLAETFPTLCHSLHILLLKSASFFPPHTGVRPDHDLKPFPVTPASSPLYSTSKSTLTSCFLATWTATHPQRFLVKVKWDNSCKVLGMVLDS